MSSCQTDSEEEESEVDIEVEFNYAFTQLSKAKKENKFLKEELIKLKKSPQI
jgi:hypothetical protein